MVVNTDLGGEEWGCGMALAEGQLGLSEESGGEGRAKGMENRHSSGSGGLQSEVHPSSWGAVRGIETQVPS